MRIVELKNIDALIKSQLPVYILHPEFFFGEGEFLVIEHESAHCSIKIERKKFFTIGLLTGIPFFTNDTISEKQFLNALQIYLKKEKICDLLNHSLHFFTCTMAPSKSYVAEIGSLSVALNRSEEEIYKGFAANYRNEIRKVEKEEFQINKGITVDAYYEIYCTIQKRQNLATYPISFFEKLIAQRQYETLLWTIEVNQVAEGFACVIVDKKNAYYFFGGANFPTRFPGSNKLLQRELMFYLNQLGVDAYELGGYRLGDMEGTKLKGVQSFKKRFGAEISKKNVFYTRIRPIKAWSYQNLLSFYLKIKKIKQNQQGIDYVYQED